ncbi:MAG: NAD(P)/FAD-dependent oxidoreductase [Chitinophagaceae bacterium]|nr:NAD(P)/FAD-dependent oxidoreductase [Chitinophagaceae bacterium]
MKRIIIIGGGFAGLKLAEKLNNTAYDVLLIDKLNHHQFQPLFYQVATAGLEPSSISFPLRGIFHHSRNVRIRYAEVSAVIPDKNCILTSIGELTYDYLVIATGVTTNFFGNKNLEKWAYPMKSTSEAINIRQHVLQNFEDALVASEEDRRRLMNVVIVGGGPTGVELSGAFAEMKRHVFPRDYPELDFKQMNVILMEGSDKTLGNMSSQSSAKSKQYLEELGVTVMLNTRVKDYDGQQVLLEDGNVVPSNTVIWAAGIRGNAIDGMPVDAITHGNRFLVDRFSLVKECANIYAIGDIAFMVTEKYPQSHPQVANVALGQAAVLAKNFRQALQSKPWQPYEYKDKGSMATVGKHKAVVDLGFGHFQGFFAWFVWMGLHLLLLMGMKNKIFVFVDWLIAYFSNDSTLRLIFSPVNKKKHSQGASQDASTSSAR